MITPKVKAFAEAIAHAEGFGVAGAIPTHAHNPGDLVMPNWTGGRLGAEGISVFADDATGWAALYRQLDLIVSRKSHVYTPSMTLLEMANKWTRTQPKIWAQNVADYLSDHEAPISVQATLGELLL